MKHNQITKRKVSGGSRTETDDKFVYQNFAGNITILIETQYSDFFDQRKSSLNLNRDQEKKHPSFKPISVPHARPRVGRSVIHTLAIKSTSRELGSLTYLLLLLL